MTLAAHEWCLAWGIIPERPGIPGWRRPHPGPLFFRLEAAL